MDTKQQNITLIALAGVVAALAALLAIGWHRTTMSAPTLPCENQTVVSVLHINGCLNYNLYRAQ